MNPRTLPKTLALSFALLTAFSSCAGLRSVTNSVTSVFGGKDKGGLSQADDLLTRIERVHIESEVSREAIRTAVGTLRGLVAPGFTGDAEKAYAEFVKSVEDSERRAKVLRSAYDAMKKSAEPYFNQWAADLENFSSTEMRLRSQNRLLETRERYDAVVTQVSPTLTQFDTFNGNLRDHALFLGNDFNSGAIAAIQAELKALSKMAVTIDRELVTSMEVARNYVEAASPTTSFESTDKNSRSTQDRE